MSDLVTKIEKAVAEWTRSFLNDPNNHSPIAAHIAAALTPSHEAGTQPVVSIKPMELSGERVDYFVSIKVGDREVTPHVFSEEYKSAYHVALYDWLLNGSGEEPDVMDFGPDDYPARAAPKADITNHHNALLCPYCNPQGLKFAEAGTQEPVADEPRFFIDHGMIHDRETGKHVTTEPDSAFCDGIERCCELLNALAERREPKAFSLLFTNDWLKEKIKTDPDVETEAGRPLYAAPASQDATREALEAIRIYAADTLSGRTDGPDDRDWQREAVREIHRRALAALRSPARADRAVTADESANMSREK